MLSYGEEVSGYDIKKWTDWSIRHYYWSPSFSQVYSELKRLEKHGFATSRMLQGDGARQRRMYTITDAGLAAIATWETQAPVDAPMLKHPVLLRVAFGHLSTPDRLREMLRRHIERVDSLAHRVRVDSTAAEAEPAWAYARIAMRWAERYYAAERELALALMDELDGAAEVIAAAEPAEGRFPVPRPGHWREVEQQVREIDADEARGTGS
ncbi:PadR family transcriptional regulator [Gordonia sp. OPL2]|uniref:PadR family transcriptional regulator n=1 Tax=Gordonia sp. OPL2 TaxID=2486274 RepID=UPI0016561B6A|nr:PadR family transcriptional regulator [Gordonia sp. OPL2]RPA02625.1 PadR family transcriptional regulator [Gordonia sp. OPL2]